MLSQIFHKSIASIAAGLAAAVMLSTLMPVSVRASYVDTNLNTFIHDAEDLQVGYVGQDMQLHVRIGYNGVNGLYNPATDEINNVRVRLSNDQNYLTITDSSPNTSPKNNPYKEDSEDDSEAAAHDAYNEGWKNGIQRAYNASIGLTYPVDGGKYPFEVNNSIFTQEQNLGTLKKGQYTEAVFNVTVRSDALQDAGSSGSYFGIPFTIWYDVPANSTGASGHLLKTEFVNVYIAAAGDVTVPSATVKDKTFAIGENQSTPKGSPASVMEFGVNLRNQKSQPLYDVNVHLNTVLAKDLDVQKTANSKSSATTDFPFNINEANYDRHFDVIQPEETFAPPYSMSVKKTAAAGYYPLSYTVTYKQTPTATVSISEDYTFYVNITNPAMTETETETYREFNENDRTKARIVVDSYHTEPEKVYAGQPFTLVLNMKNASSSISASNLLFTMESEKVSDSAVFAMQGGTSSIAVDSLAAGASTELKIGMQAASGVDPRSYSLKIHEKYDSPEFKNAAEDVEVDINVLQNARLSVSNFDVMPASIEVGNEADVMFGINNTGKVTLYNVEASFAADSIKSASTYVGNIKPGETGNVDVMLEGIAPTTDDGTIAVTITYEDVDGNPSSQAESVNLMVTEAMDNFQNEAMEMPEEKPSFIKKYKVPLLIGVCGLIAAGFGMHHFRKKKKNEAEDETI
ncbi:COG1361 S-layer family protein [Oribacterium sp. HCP28S3_H8]|uniref:COG1361 S-layer family protein n=1 Tax=Oribacterium sp. HCP28S3_H8 TaxID=3438945 RepID=UPI003F886C43